LAATPKQSSPIKLSIHRIFAGYIHRRPLTIRTARASSKFYNDRAFTIWMNNSGHSMMSKPGC
ncbi:MAG: hypothetical protein L0Z53_26705, partial [Acidobacteriales bacterium]|nr:hypothetical protein [Terriglobales bacterium]